MAIVDINGNPIRLEREPQTENDSVLGQLRRHYSDHPTVGLTPSKAAMALRDAEQGNLICQCELAEDMEEKDAHLQSELGKRRRSLLSMPWTIKPPRNPSAEEQRDADMLTEILEDSTWFGDCIFDATDAILKGFSAQEFTGWEQVEGLMLPKGIEWRDPAWFQTHPDNRNQLRLRDNSYEGAELNPFGWIVHNAKSKSGYLARTGLIRTLVWPFLFKNYSVRDLAEFLEIYGLPVRLGKYPEGATDKEKTTLLNAVLSIGHNAGGIIPRGMEIEFQNAASGQADPFVVMMDWCERSMSKAILGGTLTSQADGKSSTNALGNVHNEVRMEVRDSDVNQLAATLTRDLIYPLFALNGKSFQSPRRLPRLEFDTSEPEDVSQYAESLPKLVGIGMQIPVTWVHEKLQIPQGDGTEPVLKVVAPAQPAVALSAQPQPGWAVLAAEQAASGQQTLDQQAAGVTPPQWDAIAEPLLAPIIKLIQQEGPDAVAVKLGDLFPHLDDTKLTELLTRALFVADMWGRVDAGQD